MILLFWVLNFAISIFNSWAVGREWIETKAIGGFARFMSWMGAIMSAVGFTWCYLVILVFAAGPSGYGKLPQNYVEAMFSLGYLIIIGPCIGSGLAITVQSWMHFARNRSFGSGAVAGYNTFADIYNIYGAVRYVPSAWANVSELLFGKKGKSSSNDGLARLAIILAILAVVGGCLTAAAIIRTVSERAVARRRLRYMADA